MTDQYILLQNLLDKPHDEAAINAFKDSCEECGYQVAIGWPAEGYLLIAVDMGEGRVFTVTKDYFLSSV